VLLHVLCEVRIPTNTHKQTTARYRDGHVGASRSPFCTAHSPTTPARQVKVERHPPPSPDPIGCIRPLKTFVYRFGGFKSAKMGCTATHKCARLAMGMAMQAQSFRSVHGSDLPVSRHLR
jgi:hypothetical protein